MRSGPACDNPLSNLDSWLWQSARRLFYSWHTRSWSAEQSKRLNSSSRHFTSRVPLFEASYLFSARLLENKIPTRRIV
jgi:hypothetical protein